MWLFYYFNFERNYDVLKKKNPAMSLKKYKYETESKKENLTQYFRETKPCALAHTRIANQK